MNGIRIEAALNSLVTHGQLIPLAHFVRLDESQLRMRPKVFLNYQQAMALTVFLMQWHQGTYRDAFLDYVRDAYHGRLRRSTGRSLQDRLGQPYSTIEGQFLTFLKNGQTELRGGEPAQTRPVSSRRFAPFPMNRSCGLR